MAIDEASNDSAHAGVRGTNTAGGDGVVGEGRRGVVGISPQFQGVFGHSDDNAGVVGESANFHAVFAISHSSNNAGVIGINETTDHKEQGFGVIGRGRVGVRGESVEFQGVSGTSTNNAGVAAESTNFHALFGISHAKNNAGIFATNDNEGGFAGIFQGPVDISGVLRVQGKVVDPGNIASETSVNGLVQQVAALGQQLSASQQQVSALGQQLAALQQKEAADRQDEVNGINILAARIAALGG